MEKNFTAALEYYTEAERMRPGYPEPLLNMAGIYKELGNVSESLPHNDCVLLNPANDAILRKVRCGDTGNCC